MKKLLVFGASNSRQSINQQLATWAAGQIAEAELDIIDLNDFETVLYSIDREKTEGIPAEAHAFKKHIEAADGIVISFAEHNGSYTVAFKNIFDWVSRLGSKVWMQKPMLLLATSPGRRGGSSVLHEAVTRFPFMGGQVVAHFSLPEFGKKFSTEMGITDTELAQQFSEQATLFSNALEEVAAE
ncbi:MAG: NAD(P)H-dependent oxidoreductase [Bacteroidota bacterium]